MPYVKASPRNKQSIDLYSLVTRSQFRAFKWIFTGGGGGMPKKRWVRYVVNLDVCHPKCIDTDESYIDTLVGMFTVLSYSYSCM